MPPAIPRNEIEARLTRELDRLKRRILSVERAGVDRWRRISFLYRAADLFGRRVFEDSFCRDEASAAGCSTGACCRCRPDVFQYEREVLDLLPKRIDDSGFCPFFNLKRRNCGVYAVRPFACRLYFNFSPSSGYCRNPSDLTLQLLDGVKRHLEQVLGPYTGGYEPRP